MTTKEPNWYDKEPYKKPCGLCEEIDCTCEVFKSPYDIPAIIAAVREEERGTTEIECLPNFGMPNEREGRKCLSCDGVFEDIDKKCNFCPLCGKRNEMPY